MKQTGHFLRDDVVEKRMYRWNIPKRYWKCSLDKIPKKLEYKKDILAYIDDIDNRIESGDGLLLWGDYGTGKTAIACCILKEAIRKRYNVYFINSFEIPGIYRNRDKSSDGELMWKKLSGKESVELLVIDDFGSEEGESKLFENLMRSRNDWCKSTILTMNSLKIIKDKFNLGLQKRSLINNQIIECKGKQWLQKRKRK